MVKAILSTVVVPLDGTYKVETLNGDDRERTLKSIVGIPHYIGHPATKETVEAFGAIPAPSKLFPGLQVGETALCLPIRQGLSSRVTEGYSVAHQAVDDIRILDVRRLIRVE